MSKKKIKLLHIITHLELGGAQKTTLWLIERLNQELFDIHFASSPQGKLIKELEKIKGIKIKWLSTLRREINPFFDLLALIDLLIYIKKHNFDIVHTHSPKAGILGRWAARLGGVSYIIHTVHGLPFYEGQNFFLKKLYIFAERITASITQKFIVVCKSDKEKGIFFGIGSEDKYILIREGIDGERLKQIEMRPIFDIPPDSPLIGMVSCLKKQKSPLDFVRMAYLLKKEIPTAKFILVGDGPLRKKTENLVKRLGLERNFYLLGWREDALEIISLFDVFVLTSLWEGLPLVLLEAIALGKPVVATGVDGINELIQDGESGFLIKPGDYRNLAQKVLLFLRNEGLRENFVRKASEKLREFDISLMVKHTEELYLTLN